MLILAGDIELYPGPSTKCCDCLKTIRKNPLHRLCAVCKKTFHAKCLLDRIDCKKTFHAKCLLDRIDDKGNELFECKLCSLKNSTQVEHGQEENDFRPLYENLIKDFSIRGLKVFHQNVNGLFSKFDALNIFLQQTKKSIHVMGITETHLNGSHVDTQFKIEGYAIIRKDQASGQGGGVCAYIRDDMNWERRYDLEHKDIEGIWIELFIKRSKSLLIGFIY